jgi:hypothetical protein
MNKGVFFILKSAGRYVFKMADPDAGRMVITGIWDILSNMDPISIIAYTVVQICGDFDCHLCGDHSFYD